MSVQESINACPARRGAGRDRRLYQALLWRAVETILTTGGANVSEHGAAPLKSISGSYGKCGHIAGRAAGSSRLHPASSPALRSQASTAPCAPDALDPLTSKPFRIFARGQSRFRSSSARPRRLPP